MKNLLASLFLITTLLIVSSCTKDEPLPEPTPIIEFAIDSLYISEISMIDSGAIDPSIRISFHADNLVKAQIEEMGFVWADHSNPMITDNKVATTAGMDDRRFDLTDTIALTGRGKQIYIRAYVQNTKKEVYYSDEKLLDIQKIPTLIKSIHPFLVQPFSAFIRGSVIEGSDQIIEWGAILDTNPITDEIQGKKIISGKVPEELLLTLDTFKLEGLEKLKEYHFRFYAKTTNEILWGDNITLVTPNTNTWIDQSFRFPANNHGPFGLVDNFYATIGNKLYTASFFQQDSAVRIYSYDVGASAWQFVTRFPEKGLYNHFELVHYNEKGLIFGYGSFFGDPYKNFIWHYDFATNIWSQIPPPKEIESHASRGPIAFVIQDKIFVGFGERPDEFYLQNKLFLFLPLENDWLPVSSMPWRNKYDIVTYTDIYYSQGFSDHAITIGSGKYDRPSNYPAAFRFDFNSLKTEMTFLPEVFRVDSYYVTLNPVVNTVNDKSYILVNDKILIYDSEAEQWNELAIPAGKGSEGMFCVENTIYLLGYKGLVSYTFD